MPEQANAVSTQVGEYWDDIGALIEVVGGNLHLGYWTDDADDTPFLAAMDRLTSIMEERLALRPGMRVLDVGCGVAEPAVRMAQRNDVSFTGVTVSDWQIQEANRRINAAGLRGRVRIEHADASKLPFADGSFDRVLAFDSLPNSEDKGQWMTEMFRVLRPGGLVVFSEYTKAPGITQEELAVLKGFAIFDPPAPEMATTFAEAAGFEIIERLDCGGRVRRSYFVIFDKLAEQRDALVAAYGGERIAAFEADLRTSFAICGDRLGYLIVTGRKPGA